MKLTLKYTITGRPETTTVVGWRAIAATEQNYRIHVATDGLDLDSIMFALWAQLAEDDNPHPGPWREFRTTVDDFTVVPDVDPTGPAPGPLPAASSDSPSAPGSPTRT